DCNSNGAYDVGEPCLEGGEGEGEGGEHEGGEGEGEGGGDDHGQPTCDICGYAFAGEGDHHGHCDKCEFVFTSDNDQHGHCDRCEYIFSGEGDHHGHCDRCDHIFSGDDDRHGHCDRCEYIFSGEGDHHGHCDRCDHIFSGDDDRHGHCDHEGCDFVGNSEEDWQNHYHDDGGPGGGELAGEPDPVWEAFDQTMQNGGTPQEGFDAAAAKVYELEVDSGNMSQEEYDEGKAKAQGAFDDALADGKTPEEAFGAAMAAAGPPVPTNHWDGNCAAMCEGMGEYWLDSDGDGQPEDGPYAIWDHDADGNPVDCGCGDDGGEDGNN
ncbi:MAG: hypothetical protein U9N31_02135, partial [Candidatus Marinimicrobia bacterium]|nr:hypothetical protein [Candidatus Neomarinimicrobiota bacterium]